MNLRFGRASDLRIRRVTIWGGVPNGNGDRIRFLHPSAIGQSASPSKGCEFPAKIRSEGNVLRFVRIGCKFDPSSLLNMNLKIPTLFALLLTVLGITPEISHAQRMNLSAREAIGLVSNQFGPPAVDWIAEMSARGGIPQPSDWELIAYDQRAPRLLYRFWAGSGRAGEGGFDDQRYPDDVPVGYFSPNQIGVDSVAAFTIAEGEARKAKMAFDSCDYLLRVREYSNDPLWRLELLDASRRIVGKLYISGTNGAVLRTVWVYRDQRARTDGLPLIIDSAAPAGATSSLDLSTNAPVGAAPYPYPPEAGGAGFPPAGAPGERMGIQSVPLPPAPGMAVNTPQPYAPVDQSGRIVDGGIPAPPPLSQTQPPAPPVVSAPPAPPASTAPQMTDPRVIPPAPPVTTSKPPVPVPSKGGGGNSDRIPPPPIPR